MRRRTRSFVGTIVMIAFVLIYAPLAMALADSRIAQTPPLVQSVLYAILGLAWIIPLMPLIRWMERPDRDPAGVALFGLSRGGGTALCVAAEDPTVWAVATDGAFPTRGTMLAYILRWAEIYVGSRAIWRRMPCWMFAFAGWAGRMSSQRRSGRRYPDIERAASRLAATARSRRAGRWCAGAGAAACEHSDRAA